MALSDKGAFVGTCILQEKTYLIGEWTKLFFEGAWEACEGGDIRKQSSMELDSVTEEEDLEEA